MNLHRRSPASLGCRAASLSIIFRLGFVLTVLLAVAPGWAATPVKVVPLPDDPACTAEDRRFMARAYELAASAAAHGNSTYGALLVMDGRIIMEGENNANTSHDVTHHAETGLISAASVKLGKAELAKCVLYTSTEPCIMCCGSINNAGIKKFVYGTTAIQVTRLRGRALPIKPLECREVYQRIGAGRVVILGPLMEDQGLAVHAAAMAKTTP
jgi:tRNA(Arg) A34 adenosine deaminase TadA